MTALMNEGEFKQHLDDSFERAFDHFQITFESHYDATPPTFTIKDPQDIVTAYEGKNPYDMFVEAAAIFDELAGDSAEIQIDPAQQKIIYINFLSDTTSVWDTDKEDFRILPNVPAPPSWFTNMVTGVDAQGNAIEAQDWIDMIAYRDAKNIEENDIRGLEIKHGSEKRDYHLSSDYQALNKKVRDTYVTTGSAQRLQPVPEGKESIEIDANGIIREWDPSKGLYVYRGQQSKPSASQPHFLNRVEENGFSWDEYGYEDPVSGETVITDRRSINTLQDPKLTIDQQIAESLSQAATLDSSDPDYAKAQKLWQFKTQPTSQEALRTALDIAQSPSDYLTLVGLYTGELARANPAMIGERVAPLAPFLQQAAENFFLNIPGINERTVVLPDESVDKLTTKEQETTTAQPQQVPITAKTVDLSPPELASMQRAGRRAVDLEAGLTPEWGSLADNELDIYYGETGQVPVSNNGNGNSLQNIENKSADKIAQSVLQWGQNFDQKVYGSNTDMNSLSNIYKNTEETREQEYHEGGIVGGMPNVPQSVSLMPGEMVLTEEAGKELLRLAGLTGKTWKPPLQQMPQALTRPATTQIAGQLMNVRPRSLQTVRRMTPTQRSLYKPMIESFGVPFEDFSYQEQQIQNIGGPRRQTASFRPASLRNVGGNF